MAALPIDAAHTVIAAGHTPSADAVPCSCRHARDQHAGSHQAGACATCSCRRYRAHVVYSLAARAAAANNVSVAERLSGWLDVADPHPKGGHKRWGARVSDVGACPKAVEFRELHPELGTDPVDEVAALLGRLLHDLIMRAGRVHTPWRLFELELQPPGLDRVCRCDDYDGVLGQVNDNKTKSDAGWVKIGTWGPNESDWEQVAIYGYTLARTINPSTGRPYPVRTLRLTYVRRSTLESETFDREYNERFGRAALDRLVAMNMAMEAGIPLPRTRSGPTTDVICARHCRYVSACWNVQAARAAKRSPESYTTLGAHPNPEHVAYAANLAHDWSLHKSEANREYKSAITLLEGLQGRYGIYDVKKRGRGMPDHKRWWEMVHNAALEYLAWPEHIRGSFVDWVISLEVPRRRDEWTEVIPMRASQQLAHLDDERRTPV